MAINFEHANLRRQVGYAQRGGFQSRQLAQCHLLQSAPDGSVHPLPGAADTALAFDPALAAAEEFEVVVQVNGRPRSHIMVPPGCSREDTEARAKADPRIAEMMAGKRVIKVVVIPDKLVNIVVK